MQGKKLTKKVETDKGGFEFKGHGSPKAVNAWSKILREIEDELEKDGDQI